MLFLDVDMECDHDSTANAELLEVTKESLQVDLGSHAQAARDCQEYHTAVLSCIYVTVIIIYNFAFTHTEIE